jgi:DNA repair protein SbcC/Rad50
VLPQGEFAALLHAKPAKRQDMLIALLDLGLYDAMGQAARSRVAAAESKVEVLDGQLAHLADATEEAIRDAERRVTVLDRLVERIDEARPRLEELAKETDEAQRDATEAAERVEALAGLRTVPAEVPALAERVRAADMELGELQTAYDAAANFLARLEADGADDADHARLDELVRAHRRVEDLTEKAVRGEGRATETDPALAEAEASRGAAGDAYAAAKLALVEAQGHHQAAAVAQGLVVGATCPVCQQTVHHLPEHGEAADLAALEAAQAAAFAAMDEADGRARAAQLEHERVTGRLGEVQAELTEARAEVEGRPSRPEAERAIAAADRRARDLRTARQTERSRRTERDAAETRLQALRDDEREARQRFHAARDAVVALGAPTAAGDDLAADWEALVGWAVAAHPEQEERATAARTRVEEAEAERRAIDERILATCAELDVTVGDGDPRDAATAAREAARARAESLAKDRARARELQEQREGLVEQRRVAEELGRHLRADHFEKWVLDEALQGLVVGATEILQELSAGAYSLTLDGRGSDFAVVDHANADAVRGAKTLSGGETFLASLALALALARQVADLAAGGSARLESIFCDEGFGSLDLDTLDVVAAALEELGASGRMVGVVSHVRELAERLPVRFEVRKGPTTSTVERVEA